MKWEITSTQTTTNTLTQTHTQKEDIIYIDKHTYSNIVTLNRRIKSNVFYKKCKKIRMEKKSAFYLKFFLEDRHISAINETISTNHKISSRLMRRHTHSFAIKIDFIFLYCFQILSTLAFGIDLEKRKECARCTCGNGVYAE